MIKRWLNGLRNVGLNQVECNELKTFDQKFFGET